MLHSVRLRCNRHCASGTMRWCRARSEYELVVRQEPKQARMCGVGADRRPIDPPPIVQLRVIDPTQHRHGRDSRSSSPALGILYVCRSTAIAYVTRIPPPKLYISGHPAPRPERVSRRVVPRRWPTVPGHEAHVSAAFRSPHSVILDGAAAMAASQSFLQNPYYFMFASLAKPDEDVELHWLKDGKTRCTTGSVVSSLYHLKDTEAGGADAGFFVFPDLSVRTEGSYRLKLSLFEVVGNCVDHCKSIFSAPFYVYTAKKFPGMEESTLLSCSLADQGIKIRIRKDIRVRRRPAPGGEAPIPIPIPGPPPPGGAFGPVPVRLDDPVTDEEQGLEDRERRLSTSNSVAPIPETEAEHSRRVESDRDSDRDDTPKRVPARRTSDSTHSAGSRRGSGSDRGSKRRRGDSGGLSIGTSVGRGIVDGPEGTPISAGPSSAGTGWGSIDPALGASSAAAQQSPSTPTSSSADHHYAPAATPQAAPIGYEHRYSATPANASIPAPAPAAPSNYPYDAHPHHPPPPSHHYSAPSAPHAYAHVPPAAQHATPYPYSSPQQAPTGQSWGYDAYGHSQSYNMPPPGPPSSQTHHNPTHPPPAQRYPDYPPYAQQGYGGYYEHPAAPSQHHVQPSPTSHSAPHSYHTAYGSAPTPPSPTTNQASAAVSDYYAGRADARAGSHVPPSGAAGGGYAQTAYTPPPSAYAPPASAYSQYSHNPGQGHASQQTTTTTTPTSSQASSSGRGHYQLSTPPHHHQTQPYSQYPPGPIPGASVTATATAAATPPADTNWGYQTAPAPAASASAWGVIQESPYAANYGGPGAAARDAHGHGPRLAPLRGGGGGTPPPGSVEGGRGGSSKKNPLSIGNIISEDTG
ncbi:hypothetical protein FOMPIDRAFT_1060568 [Fomitopsis schrenkii]|uniref:Velvet domain-containing protein n=1 Tax=Fomitopsis schrenkii TaxID=2126942 RepID=S8FEY7_FOMSC|nr:hypothetical protein FOMPIDRAFT_1060568 [Fomitopsis schrenkii]